MIARQTVLFIGGLGRSGSTLIEKMMNELPDVFAVGETVHLWERGVRDNQLCGCGIEFANCEFWAPVGERAFGGWGALNIADVIDLRWSVDRSRRLPQMFGSHRFKKVNAAQQSYLNYIGEVLAAAGYEAGKLLGRTDVVIVDSSKHLSSAALYALDPRLDVRVLHVIRDPRGVAYSWTKRVARPEADGELMPTYDPKRTALRWVTDNLGFRILAKTGVPTLSLRYEDFLEDPSGWLRRICGFAGLADPDLSFLVGPVAVMEKTMHSVAGNPMRFGRAEVTLKVDDAWRVEMDSGSRRLVTAITAPVLGLFGYRR